MFVSREWYNVLFCFTGARTRWRGEMERALTARFPPSPWKASLTTTTVPTAFWAANIIQSFLIKTGKKDNTLKTEKYHRIKVVKIRDLRYMGKNLFRNSQYLYYIRYKQFEFLKICYVLCLPLKYRFICLLFSD
jgi:hypothetical protein